VSAREKPKGIKRGKDERLQEIVHPTFFGFRKGRVYYNTDYMIRRIRFERKAKRQKKIKWTIN